jgi:hypothetical protein
MAAPSVARSSDTTRPNVQLRRLRRTDVDPPAQSDSGRDAMHDMALSPTALTADLAG